ncbi:hypothetical protein GCM10009838_11660 [Catenulispora subtropica]|uniref:LamG-like jellyroll fold domain-containing protein n=1 Tax=Catenulispora subtropica TaxID=450798 RepID=A0ABN2QRV0_9ACTN
MPGSTTPTDTLTANPDGTFTVDHALAPVRKRVGATWAKLDPTLVANPDGTISPRVTTSPVTMSGGGSGPLATLGSARRSLALSLPTAVPTALPKPTLAGATATYASVLPGVDLKVTVDAQGGVSEVLVIRDAAAAANPALTDLELGTAATGLSLAADPAGNITGKDAAGHVVIAAPAPMIWDSAEAPEKHAAAVPDPAGVSVDAANGLPLASSAAAPGEGAHQAKVKVALGKTASGKDAIKLTPDRSMFTSAATKWPVYFDPTFIAPSAGSQEPGWTTVTDYWSTTSFWKTSGNLKVGYCGWSYCNNDRNRSFVDVSVPSQIWGSTVLSSQINFNEVWSPSCTATPVELWSTGSIGAGTTWSNQPAWYSKVGTQSVAKGYSSGCPSGGVGFDITSVMQTAANNHAGDQTFGLRAGDESDAYGWKQFSSAVTVSTTYDHAPNTPNGLSTSPATACGGTPSTVGDGDVTLYAPLSDPDNGTLGAAFSLWNTATGAPIASSTFDQVSVTSGSTAVFTVHEAALKQSAGGAVTQFSWHVQASDYKFSSAWSATCTFDFDPTRQGAPSVTEPVNAKVGTPVSITIAKPLTGTVPSSYLYQLNGTAAQTVTAASGGATVTITPTRFTNILSVTSVSAGGNIGDTAVVEFNAAAATTQAPNDMTGHGIADLLTVGGVNGLPSGLWLAPGQAAAGATAGTGQVQTAATNIGVNGNGYSTADTASDYDGAQAITGHFNGSGFNDVLVYYPTGANAAGGAVISGTGDGSPLQPQYSGNENTLTRSLFVDPNGANPVQLATAGNASRQNLAYPDLIGVAGPAAGSGGYTLDLYPNGNGAYGAVDVLSNTAPDGTMNWNNWTIADTVMGDGSTAMFLWNRSTGALYLWTGLNGASAYANGGGALAYTQYLISTGWHANSSAGLQAADINHDGVPDLWTVGAGGTVTAWLVGGLSGTPTISAQSGQTLQTAAHTWLLNDQGTSGAAYGTAKDLTVTGGLNASTTNVTGNSGDLFSPDAKFGGSGDAVTTGPAVNTASDFTVSAWVKPDTANGVVLSQDGAHTSGFMLYPNTAGGDWAFCIATADTAGSWPYDCASGGTIQHGVWTRVTATYKASTGIMSLYLNGVNVGLTTHTAVSGITGPFHMGDYLNDNARASYYTGQLADVQTWNQVVPPTAPASADGYFVPLTPTRLLDTRNSAIGGYTGPVASGSTVSFQVLGAAGGAIPSTGVTAVAMSITAVGANNGGFLTAYPDGTPLPVSSTVNYGPAANITNGTIVPVGADGKVAIHSHGMDTGTTVQVLADVTGYFTTDSGVPGAGTYVPIAATRFLDTRNGTGRDGVTGPIASGSSLSLPIAGVAGIPAADVTGVVINLTTANSGGNGPLLAYADGTSTPTGTTVQTYASGSAVAAEAVVPVGADGKIAIYNGGLGTSTDIIGDVVGYFSTSTGGQKYHTLDATRLFDSRLTGGAITSTTPRAYLQTAVNAVNPTFVLNITATGASGIGNITAIPDGGVTNGTSGANYTAGGDVADMAVTATHNNMFDLAVQGAATQVVVDTNGYFATF